MKYKLSIPNWFNIAFLLVVGCSLPSSIIGQTKSDSLAQLKQYIAQYEKGLQSELKADSTYFYILQSQHFATNLKADSLLAEINNYYLTFFLAFLVVIRD
ncbi:MAG: hypothetical protein AB8G22_12345 [Saprospiraceae bacterium]